MSRLRSRLQKNGFNLELLTGPLRGLFNGLLPCANFATVHFYF